MNIDLLFTDISRKRISLSMKGRPFGWLTNYGFTLLEILLAIVIIGTVLSTVFASYKSTFRTMHAVESQLETYEMARMTLERMIKDLESVHVAKDAFQEDQENPSWYAFEADENSINGEHADSLRFTSNAHVAFGPENVSGMAMITYYVEEKQGTNTLVLFRSDSLLMEKERGIRLSDAKQEGFPLCEGLASVDFQYLDDEGDTQETWSLPEEKALPLMVIITLGFVDPETVENRYIFTTTVGMPTSQTPDDDE